MQLVSAVVLAAFAASTWIAGQNFIQREAHRQSRNVSIPSPALLCDDRALTVGYRAKVVHRRGKSCEWGEIRSLSGKNM
jgi:hypothetical protein